MLNVKNINQYYGGSHILRDVSLQATPGKVTVILGRNGVGKTTLLATIMGLTTFHSGSIHLRGIPIESMPVHRRSRLGIGFVPQTRDIFASLTVEENLAVAARPGRWSLQRVYDLFPRLAERRSHMGNQISGGEQQMLAMGRALMGDPSLLLLDEPLEGLAPIIVDTLLAAIQRLSRDEALTVVLVEQSAKLALEVTDRVLVLNRGRIVFEGASAQLLSDPERLSELVVAG